MSLGSHRARKRIVRGLVWAVALPERPKSIPNGHPRKLAKLNGIRYENSCAKALSKMVHGQWFSFQDSNGQGYCQPDLLQLGAEAVLVIEVKYTWRPEAHEQLERLYRPIVEKAFSRPMIGVVMVKSLSPRLSPEVTVTRDLADAIQIARQGHPTVLHWLGRASLRGVDPYDPLFSIPKRERFDPVSESRVPA